MKHIYLVMASAAIEIQKRRPMGEPYQVGDYYLIHGEREPRMACTKHVQRMPGHCWIPRQDQLQDIRNEHNGSAIAVLQMLNELEEIALDKSVNRVRLLHHECSMEEVWLTVVMHKCYEKAWNRENKQWYKILDL